MNKIMDKKAIREGYHSIADKIGMPKKFYKTCLKAVGSIDGYVLDIGCGQGFLLKEVKESHAGIKPFALDHSLELCKRTVENINHASVIQADAAFLPYRDAVFNLVMLTEVIEHLVDDPINVIKEVKRILVPGGKVLMSVPNRDWFNYERYLEKREIFQPVDDKWFRVKEIKELVQKAGFNIKKIRGQENLYFGGGAGHLLEKVGLLCLPKLHERMKRLIILAQKD